MAQVLLWILLYIVAVAFIIATMATLVSFILASVMSIKINSKWFNKNIKK